MKFRKHILMGMLCSMAALPAAAVNGHYAITTAQIAAAVSSSGLRVSPEQVTLMTNVVANVADPVLKVKSIDNAGARSAIARLECARQQCLPFLVTLRTSVGVEPVVQFTAPVVSNVKPQTLVHNGLTAMLHLEGPHVHISLNVICMDNGAAGQTIRATSLDRKQVYSVKVASDGTLEGRL
jgi:hypothetical protein